MKKKMPKYFYVVVLVFAAFVAFIWIQSTLTATQSAAESKQVYNFIIAFFQDPNLTKYIDPNSIRKYAHAFEFFILGGIVSTFFMIILKLKFHNKIKARHLGICLPLCLIVCSIIACIDEFIQNFSTGRGPRFSDFIIDFGGFTASIVICFLIFIIFNKLRSKR